MAFEKRQAEMKMELEKVIVSNFKKLGAIYQRGFMGIQQIYLSAHQQSIKQFLSFSLS